MFKEKEKKGQSDRVRKGNILNGDIQLKEQYAATFAFIVEAMINKNFPQLQQCQVQQSFRA